MAIEIPVIFDVLGSANRSLKDIPQVIQTMQKEIDENVLEIPVEINRKGDLKEVFDFVGTTSLSMNDLKYAIKSASSELARLKRTGASNEDLEKYAQAVALLKSIREEWRLNEKFASQVGDEELRNLQIQQQYNDALRISASSLNNINAKIAGYTEMLNNSDIGSVKFREAATQLGEMSRMLQIVQTNVKILGANSGSIDQLNAKLQQANQQWNQLASSKKFTADGKLTDTAKSLVAEYKKLSAELKTQGISMAELVAKEQQRIQKHQQYLTNREKENAILNTTVKTVDALQAKVNVLQARLNRTEAGSSAFQKLNQQLRQTQRDLAAVQSRMATTGVEMEKMDMTFGRLLQRSAYFFGLHAVTSFLRNVREVTAEFELQRVALGGIIQDTEEANSLFRQIKAAAIQSPFEIKDLVSYTKQLSAYRVETENLFDVTMRLADVSAGLGVDMSRLILAYGQVRAASVLRGQELRQFTEAGIPLVELLAQKFSDLNGRMVSTAEVFDLISKRAVPFEMISEIFEDMTDKGGTFYKMQEKQAETLAGQWANLKDALSIMYDEMGNTDVVHNAMTALISDAKNLMQNWRTVATVLKTVGSQYVIMKVASLFLPTLTYNTKLAEKATQALARAQQLEAAQQAKSSAVRGIAIRQLNAYSREMMKAATAQTLFGRGLRQITASFLGGGWVGLAITAMSVLAGWFISARQEANRLNKELEKIGAEGSLQINRSVSNFQRLANAAVEAADGSNEQNEALAELQRTYGDIIPSQKLQIKYLQDLKGNYEELTSAIQQKINMQIREQKVNAITDNYSKDIQKSRKSSKNLLLQYGLDKEQINAVMDEVQKSVDAGLLSINSTVDERVAVIEDIIKRLTGITVSLGRGFTDYNGEFHYQANEKIRRSLSGLVDVYANLNKDVDDVNREMENSVGTMGVYAKSWDNLKKAINEVSVSEDEFGKRTTFTFKKEKIRKEVELMVQSIEDAFEGTNIDISKAFDPKGNINFEFLNEAAAGSNRWGLQSFIKHVQESYESVVPTNRMVSVVERKFKEIADQVGLSMDDVQGYLLRGEKDMKDYTKEIASDLEEAKHKVVDYQKQTEDFAKHPGVALPVSDNDVSNANKMVEFLTLLSDWLKEYAKQKTSGSAHQTDPWVLNMQDRIKFMQDFKKGYDDLTKYLRKSSALSEEAGIMMGRGSSLGLSAADQSRAAEDLSGWYEDMIKEVSNRLRGKGVAGLTATDLLGIDTTKRSKDVQELQKLLQSLWDAKTDFDVSKKKKEMEDALKRLSDEVKRSETARNFYNNILELTGDEELATTMGVSIYGNIGDEFKDRMQEQLNGALDSLKMDRPVSEDLEKAFKTMDFEKILSIEDLPDDVESVVRDAYESVQKYNSDIAKSYAKLLMKFDDVRQKSVDIEAKANKDIANLRAGLVLKIKGINKNAEIQDKKAAISAATARAEAVEAGIKREKELNQLRLTRNYRLFFESLGTISLESARKIAKAERDLVTAQFEAGEISLSKFNKELDKIDERLAMYENDRNPLVTYLSKGIDGLVEKIKQAGRDMYALSGNILDDEGKLSFSEESIKMINKLGMFFGGDLFGVSGRKNTFEKMMEKNGRDTESWKKSLDEAGEKLAEMGSNFSRGMGWADFWVSFAGNGIKAFDQIAQKSKNSEGEVKEGWNKAAKFIMTSAAGMLTGTPITAGLLGQAWDVDDAWERFTGLNEKAMSGFEKFKQGDIIGAIIDNIEGWSEVFGKNTKKIERQIKKQGELIKDLEYEYSRLEVAIDEAFGSDYVYNYNKEIDVLQAQAEAYRKQAELERSKGKKADEDTAKGYEASARDIEDKIKDMQGQLAEFFTGTDLTSAAQDFAKAWIDAYKEFGSTTDAMKEKFNEMVENMVVNSLAAKLIQDILRPVFDQIDAASKDGELTAQEIGSISSLVPERVKMINDAMAGMVNQLGAAGINLRNTVGQFSGISRNIAGASEESINGLAAGINTQNFYMQHIDLTVSAILSVLSGGTAGTTDASGAEVVDPYKNQMLMYVASLPQMRDDMASVRAMLEKVIRPVGTTTTHYVAVKL